MRIQGTSSPVITRWMTGLNYGNLWGIGHEINYQFISANSAKKWWGNSANYVAPLPWRHTFKAFASLVKTKPNLSSSASATATDENGKGWQLGCRYIMPLPTQVTYRHNIMVGFDFKRTNNFLSFSQALIFNNYIDIDQFLVGYDGTLEGRWGMTLFGITFYLSPGGMSAYNKDRFFGVESPGAKSNYIYWRTTADGIFRMPLDFSWIISTLFQWSSGKLLPSEQLSLGGYQTIRGYDENEIVSDRGLMIKNEVRSPSLHFFRTKGGTQDELQFLAFVDFGYGNDVN